MAEAGWPGFWCWRTKSSVRFLYFTVKVVRHRKGDSAGGGLWKSEGRVLSEWARCFAAADGQRAGPRFLRPSRSLGGRNDKALMGTLALVLHSVRRAFMGSMLAARLAGMNPAMAAKAERIKTAAARVIGS